MMPPRSKVGITVVNMEVYELGPRRCRPQIARVVRELYMSEELSRKCLKLTVHIPGGGNHVTSYSVFTWHHILWVQRVDKQPQPRIHHYMYWP